MEHGSPGRLIPPRLDGSFHASLHPPGGCETAFRLDSESQEDREGPQLTSSTGCLGSSCDRPHACPVRRHGTAPARPRPLPTGGGDAARPASPSRRTRRSPRRRRSAGCRRECRGPASSAAQRQVPIAVPYSSRAATTRKTPAYAAARASARGTRAAGDAERARGIETRQHGQSEHAPDRDGRGREDHQGA